MDLLAKVAQQRDERVQDLYLDLPIPSWDGALVARFDVLPRKDIQRFIQNQSMGRDRDSGIQNDASFLAAACRGLYLLDPEKESEGSRMEGDDRYVLIEGVGGSPVKFDTQLAEKLQRTELNSAAEVVMYCFKGNDVALGAMALKVFQWMQNTDKEVADSLVGE